MQEDRSKYIAEYYKNEYDANRKMSFANAFAGIAVFICWLLYLFHVFPLHANIYILVAIIMPIDCLILFSPLLYLKSERIKKPGYKYFLIFSILFVVSAINIMVPKHGIIGWAAVLVLTFHYYNPKLGRIVFGITLFMMCFCLYAGMFLGEYDPHLLSEGIINGKVAYQMVDGKYVIPDTPKERFELLQMLLENGDNRYLKVFLFYFLPRSVIMTIIFIIGDALNRRTYKLLVSEIKVNSEQQKINTELQVAQDIQKATLPTETFVDEDIEIVGELKAAKEVGGDFYDYFNIDKDHVGIVIGDVSGKGVPAAMFMMKVITCFKNFVGPNKTPATILKEVNRSIVEGNDSKMFVTCFLAILDKKTGHLQFANAGHNPPIIGSNKNYHFIKCQTGFILGGLKEAFVTDEETILKPGESLTLYTDGITEARNEAGEFFGENRLMNAFNRSDYTCLVELHHTIKDVHSSFVKDAPQSDDITFITIKYHGDKYSYDEKMFNGKFEDLPNMLEFIKSFCKKHKFQNDFQTNLLVVGDELISNIIKYGYENQGGELFIRLLFNEDKKEFVLTIIDRAGKFNQLAVNKGIVSTDPEKQEIGGLGILIVKKIMSEYAYDRINGKNILVLRKKF